MFVLFFDLFLSESTDQFVKNYIDHAIHLEGRLDPGHSQPRSRRIIAGKTRRFGLTEQEERVWRYIAYAACAMPFILAFTPSSTAVDRMALYLMPLQVVVLVAGLSLFAKPRTGVAR